MEVLGKTAPSGPARGSTRGRASLRGSRFGRGRNSKSPNPPNEHAASEQNGKSSAAPAHAAGTRARGSWTAHFGRGRGNATTAPRAAITSTAHSKEESWRQPENAYKPEYRQHMARKFQELEKSREKDIEQAIRENKMTAHAEQRRLDQAIPKYGYCPEMCPEYERVRRIHLNMVDPCEKITLPNGQSVPCEERMVKAFKRSAADKVEEPPWELLGPETALKTLSYLFEDLLGGPDGYTPKIHSFLWDRTRMMRTELNMQTITKFDDIRMLLTCYEMIVRFHIYSLHFWANPEEAAKYPSFDRHQEYEQLNAALTGLQQKYADYRDRYQSPHEAEVNAYSIIFSLRHDKQRLEYSAQKFWQGDVVEDARVRLAFDICSAARDPDMLIGPASLGVGNPALDKANHVTFWRLVSQSKTPFLMACAAEYWFNDVRRTALKSIRKAYNRPKVGAQEDLVMSQVTKMLGFDTEQQAIDFCEAHGLDVGERADGNAFLDVRKWPNTSGDLPAPAKGKVKDPFSQKLVERKKRGRKPVALIKGLLFSEAQKQGLVEDGVRISRADGDTGSAVESAGEQKREARLPNRVSGSSAKNPFAKPDSTAPSNPFAGFGPAAGTASNPPNNIGSNHFARTSPAPESNPFAKLTTASASFANPGNPFAQSLQDNLKPFLSNEQIAQRVFSTPSSAPLSAQTGQMQNPFGKPPASGTASTPEAAKQTPENPFAKLQTPQSEPASQTQASISIFGRSGQDAEKDKQQTQTPALSDNKSKTRIPSDDQSLFVPEEPSQTQQPASGTGNSFFTKKDSQPPASAPTTTTQVPQKSIFDEPINSTPVQSNKKSLFNPFPNTSTTKAPTTSITVSDSIFFPQSAAPSQPPSKPAAPPTGSLPSAAPVSKPLFSGSPAPSSEAAPADSFRSDANTNSASIFKTDESVSRPFPAPAVARPPRPRGPSRKEQMDKLCKAYLLESPDGLIRHFLQHEIGETVKSCMRKVERERERALVAESRRFLLITKFVRRWKNLAWKGRLRRRGKKRRQEFAQSMRDTALSSATTSPAPHFSPFSSLTDPRSSATMPPPAKAAARKDHRASLPANSGVLQNDASKAQAKPHRKSALAKVPNSHASMSNGAPRESLYARPRAMTANLASEKLIETERLMRQASRLVTGQTDTTRSDYFKLKSLGIDPQAPFIPQIQPRKRAYEDVAEDLARKSRISPAKRLSGCDLAPPPAVSSKLPTIGLPRAEKTSEDAIMTNGLQTTSDDDDAAFFAQIAEMKQQMADDTAWLREAREQSERISLERANETEKQRKLREWKPSVTRTEARWQREGLPSFLRAPWTPKESGSRSTSRISESRPEDDRPNGTVHMQNGAENMANEDAEEDVYGDDDDADEEEQDGDHYQGDGGDYIEEDDEEGAGEEYEEEFEEDYEEDDELDTQAYSAFASKGASADDAIEL